MFWERVRMGYLEGFRKSCGKIPMNYAAFLFANEEEWENFQILKHTDLVKIFPFL